MLKTNEIGQYVYLDCQPMNTSGADRLATDSNNKLLLGNTVHLWSFKYRRQMLQ